MLSGWVHQISNTAGGFQSSEPTHNGGSGSQRDHNFLGSVQVAPHVSRRHGTVRAVKVLPFPTPLLSEFMAELQQEGVATADLAIPAGVEPFRQAVRREARRLGIRVRTGSGNALFRDDEGRKTWVYGRRVWACDPTCGSTRPVSDFATSPPGSAGAGCSATRIGRGRSALILGPGVLSRGHVIEHRPDPQGCVPPSP